LRKYFPDGGIGIAFTEACNGLCIQDVEVGDTWGEEDPGLYSFEYMDDNFLVSPITVETIASIESMFWNIKNNYREHNDYGVDIARKRAKMLIQFVTNDGSALSGDESVESLTDRFVESMDG